MDFFIKNAYVFENVCLQEFPDNVVWFLYSCESACFVGC